MSWLADASANKIVKSYIKDFVDISGNFKVRNTVGGTVVDNGPVAWSQLGSDIDGEAAGDNFGTSISLSSDGTRVVIGGSTNDGTGADAGHARVYEYNGSAWSQLGADLDSEAAGDYFGTSVSISNDGNRVAVGGDLNDGGGSNSGYARVYEYDGSSWNQLGADIDGEASDDYYGKAISLSSDGTIVAVGGHLNDGGGSNSGFVRIFAYIGSSWTQLGADLNGPTSNAYFGATVSLSSDGTIVAIGAFNTTGTSSYSGKTSIYKYNGSSWSQLGADISGEAANDKSGYDVALSSDGTIVAIGARFNDGGGSNSGHTRIYEYNGSSWSQVGGDIDGEASSDESGFSVSLSSDGTIVAVGALYNDGGGSNAGHVRIYEYDGSSWNQVGADIDGEASGDNAGFDVSLSSDGTRVAIGGKYSDGSGTDAGHARIYNKTGGTVTTPGSETIPMDVSGGIVSFNTNTMKIEDGTVDISGTTWINQGQSGASIATSNQGAFIVESAGTSSSNAVVYVETAGQTQAFSIRENGDLYSANALQHSSDDRRKTNEQYITNATETIQKLSPQIYTKLNDLVQNGGTPTKTESGLIAQEIYYNAPELRHLVHIEDSAGNKLTPQEYDLSGNDIQNDPDYTSLGWGDKSATVDYTGLIPYLIKANQEKQMILEQQDATIDEQKTMVDDLLARISALE